MKERTWKIRGVLFHVLLPFTMAEKIYELSEKMDVTYSYIIREALREYFEKLEKTKITEKPLEKM
jgi:predicted DNA-binding protein